MEITPQPGPGQYPESSPHHAEAAAEAEQIARLWQDPTLRMVASVETGEVDHHELFLLVNEKWAEHRFRQAYARDSGMDETDSTYQQYHAAKMAWANYVIDRNLKRTQRPRQ